MSITALPPLDLSVRPWPGRMIDVAGTTVHIRETPGPSPDAPVALYIHGLGGSSTNWTDLAAQLSGQVNGFAVDLPGFGRSQPPTGYTFTLADHIAVATQLAEVLSDAPVHLFGNSMGGVIALAIAAKRPELVRSLTLVSPAVPDLRLDFRRLADPRVALSLFPVVGTRIAKQLASMPVEEHTKRILRLVMAQPESFPAHRFAESVAEVAETTQLPWYQLAMERTAAGLIRNWLPPYGQSLWALAAQSQAPTLVAWGSEDRVISVRKAPKIVRLLPNGRLLVLPRTGHCAQIERPVALARAVLEMWEMVQREQW